MLKSFFLFHQTFYNSVTIKASQHHFQNKRCHFKEKQWSQCKKRTQMEWNCSTSCLKASSMQRSVLLIILVWQSALSSFWLDGVPASGFRLLQTAHLPPVTLSDLWSTAANQHATQNTALGVQAALWTWEQIYVNVKWMPFNTTRHSYSWRSKQHWAAVKAHVTWTSYQNKLWSL